MADYSGRDKRLAYLFEAVENVQVDDMTGASASTDGTHGLVPAPLAGDEDKYLKGDGTWAQVQAGAGALSGLSDVDLATPTDGQALVYDGANSKWINGNVSGGGNTLVIQDASIYSTDEQQVGVWIDEKPLYQKTISVTASGNWPSSFTTLENLPNLETCVRIELTIHRASGAYYTANGSSSAEYISVPNYTTYKVAGGVFGVGTNPHLEYYVNGYTSSDVDKIWFTLWYTKTTDAAGSGGYKAYGLSPIIYSEEEREVGVWTDGKPLYQKTIVYNSTNTSGSQIEQDVSSLTIDTCVYLDGFCDRSGTGYGPLWYRFNCYETDNYFAFLRYDDYNNNHNIVYKIKFGTRESTSSQIITIRYTKTTDTAGSGTWTTTGEYAHHYSTSEKVIGTWTDGKPLYECTWELSSAKTIGQSWASLGITLTNGKLIVDGDVIRVDNHGKYPAAFNLNTSTGAVSASTWINNLLLDVGSTITLRYTKTTD